MTTARIDSWVEEAAAGFTVRATGRLVTTYTARVHCWNEYKRLHAERLLARWCTQVRQREAITVAGTSLTWDANDITFDPYGNSGTGVGYPWVKPKGSGPWLNLSIGLAFNGSVDTSMFTGDMPAAVMGQVKKALALRTVAEFPLPFMGYLHAVGPGTVDALAITNQYFEQARWPSKSKNFAGGIESMRPVFEAVLQDYPIKLGRVLQEDWASVLMQVVWMDEIDDLGRRVVLDRLKQAFKAEEISKWPFPPTDAHFLVW